MPGWEYEVKHQAKKLVVTNLFEQYLYSITHTLTLYLYFWVLNKLKFMFKT